MDINLKTKAILLSVLATVVVGLVFTWLAINVFSDYGGVLFIFVPSTLGFISTIIYSKDRTPSFREAMKVSIWSLLVACGALILFKIEGIVCITMAAPFLIPFVLIGTKIALIVRKRIDRKMTGKVLSINLLSILVLMGTESQVTQNHDLITVSTSIEINAPIQDVWQNVVAFPDLDDPNELLFQVGVAYPTSSEIKGDGVGAIRYCEFNTGRFVEPITIWNAPNHLQFTVEEQPVPLKHMMDQDVPANMYLYFVSVKGEFILEELDNGMTRLTGSTWYYHKIKPVLYWRIWSEFIIHSIHERVLTHIKRVSERDLLNQ